MGNITIMAVFVWTINILVFLAQAAMIDMAPNSKNIFYNEEGTVLEEYTIGNNISMPNQDSIESELDPASSTGVQEAEGTGIFFIDAIASIKNWVQEKLQYLGSIVMGPYNIINSIPGLPKVFVGAVSLLWYGVSVLLLILLIFGRSD